MDPADVHRLASASLALAAVLGVIGLVLATYRVDHRPAMIAAAVASAATGIAGVALVLGPAVALRAGHVLGYDLVDLRFDALSGLFLLALGAVGCAASVYGSGYHDAGRSRFETVAYMVFIASLVLVFGSASAVSFLFAWELMALSSTVLVLGPRPNRAAVRAGFIYVAMTHIATAAIAIAFAALAAAAGSTAFADWSAASGALAGPARDLIFLLLLAGFGTKAGMIPLHVWLPRAHPIAPAHVSALMSGVMIKAGIYGLIRFAIEGLGGGPTWWGLLVLVLGALSAILGVLYALAEHDLKRLLAFHSVENIGIILLGIGVALVGASARTSSLVVVGLAAALFHTLNHAIFKGLLFLGAGAVQEASGTRDLNRLGGLARAMPLTALTFGVGAAAISGLPPLNGFASEWLTFQGLLSTGGSTVLDPAARFAGYLSVGALGLTAALAVACFVKATGMTFLALPRTPGAQQAREVGRSMRGAMAGLALACVGVGVGAGPIGSSLAGLARGLGPGAGPIEAVRPTVPPPTLGSYDPAMIGLALAAAAVAVLAVSMVRAVAARRAPTWTCGILPEPAFEYTATSYSKPLRLFFDPILRADRETHVELHEGTPFPRRVTYRSEVDHLIESQIYAPAHRAGIRLSQVARRLQQGTLQLYLAYSVGALVLLLLLAHR